MKFKSFSMIELLVAIGIFSTVVVAGLTLVTFTYKASDISAKEEKGLFLVREAADSLRHMKRNNWDLLANGLYGLSFSGNQISLVPNSDSSNGYLRVITVSDTYRDAQGQIVSSGGTLDPDTKKILISVTWNQLTKQNKSVSSTVYLANFEKTIGNGNAGLLAYADYSGSDDVIRYRLYDSSSGWGDEETVPDFGVPDNRNTRVVEIYGSNTRDEYILITKHTEDGQYIYAQVFDGENWGDVIQLAGYGNNVNPSIRNFDGAYLNNGNFLVVYDDFTFSPKYRTWNGSSWSSQETVAGIGDFPVWFNVDASPGTNNAMYALRQYLARATKSFYFNGSSWGSPSTHASGATTSSTETMSLVWSRKNPQIAAIVYSNSSTDTTPSVRIWNLSSPWTSAQSIDTGGNFHVAKIVQNPQFEEFLACVQDNSQDINCIKSSFTPTLSYTTNGEIAQNTHSGSHKSFDLGYESLSGAMALAVYADGVDTTSRRIPKYRSYTQSTATWSNQSSLSQLGADGNYALETVRVVPAPFSDDIVILMGDSSQDVTAAVWNGASNSFYDSGPNQFEKLSQNGSFDEDYWYGFAFSENEN